MPTASPKIANSISDILAEQDKLQKAMLNRLNGHEPSPQKGLTKQ